MAHIRLFSPTADGGPGLPPGENHVHVEEDLTYQSDGSRLTFFTTYTYFPGTLIVYYNGQACTKDNDFVESGPKEFTLMTGLVDDPFPPIPECPLVAVYVRPSTII